MRAILCLLCSAAAFPAMLVTERLLPLPAPADKIAWQPGKGWYHNLKNWTTESVRADSQWWSKALCFGLVAMLVIGVAAGIGIGWLVWGRFARAPVLASTPWRAWGLG